MVKLKRKAIILLAIIGLICFSVSFTASKTAKAEDGSLNNASNFYYDQLSDYAKTFYAVFASMDSDTTFATSGEYDLIANGILSQNDVMLFGGNTQANDVYEYLFHTNTSTYIAFEKALKAYSMDRCGNFYVDYDKLTIYTAYGLTTNSDGEETVEYVAKIKGENDGKYFTSNDFASLSNMISALDEYDTYLSSTTNSANISKYTDAKIGFVNGELVNNCEYVEYTGGEDRLSGTSYGAIVNHKADSLGLAKAFKATMDVLEIPCIIVEGYLYNGESYLPHFWNYVYLKDNGGWYAVDEGLNCRSDTDFNAYLLRGEEFMSKTHIVGGYNLTHTQGDIKYPTLCPYDYDENSNCSISVTTGNKNESGETTLNVSVSGKSSKELLKSGLTLIERYKTGTAWGSWQSVNVKKGVDKSRYTDKDGYTICRLPKDCVAVQYAVTTLLPSGKLDAYNANVVYENEEKLYANTLCFSEAYENTFGRDELKPSVVKTNLQGELKAGEKYKIEINYSEALKVFDEDKPVSVIVNCSNAGANALTEVSTPIINKKNSKQITFEFTPSISVNHYGALYSLELKNVVGAKTEKEPLGVFCKVGLGEVYVDTFNSKDKYVTQKYCIPTVISNKSNLSGSDGLTVTTVLENSLQDKIVKAIGGFDEAYIGELQSLNVFDIKLGLNGKTTTLTNGLFIGVPYPNGINLSNAEKVKAFKISYSDGVISKDGVEEIDCYGNNNGIVLNTNKGGLYAVAVVESSGILADDKKIYVKTFGNGETTFSKNGESATIENFISLLDGDNLEIYFNPTSDSELMKVSLNGVTVTDAITKRNDKDYLLLNYALIEKNNVLTVTYGKKSTGKAILPIFNNELVVDTVGEISTTLYYKESVKKYGQAIFEAKVKHNSHTADGDYEYEWYFNGERIKGAKRSTLTIYNFDKKNVGKYTVKVKFGNQLKTLESSHTVYVKLESTGIIAILIFVILGLEVLFGGFMIFYNAFLKNKLKEKKNKQPTKTQTKKSKKKTDEVSATEVENVENELKEEKDEKYDLESKVKAWLDKATDVLKGKKIFFGNSKKSNTENTEKNIDEEIENAIEDDVTKGEE